MVTMVLGIMCAVASLVLGSSAEASQEADRLKCDVCDRVNRKAAQFCGGCGGELV